MITTIIVFLLVLTALVFVHELGHFLAARFFGIRVDEFAIGFPPRIWGKKIGPTEYAINLLPIGGYVKIYGEQPTDEKTPDSILSKPRWQQVLVLIMGVTFNVLFAWLLLSLALMIGSQASVSNFPPEKAAQYVTDRHLIITQVLKDGPAATAGLKTGDEILNISNLDVVLASTSLSVASVQELIAKSPSVAVTYKRTPSAADIKAAMKILGASTSTEPIVSSVRVEPIKGLVSGADRKAIGIAMDEFGTAKLGFFSALGYGAKQTYYLLDNVVFGLFGFFANIFTGHANLSDVSGPVGIATVVGDAARNGFVKLLTITAIISANLAVINLLPFPALDGGRVAVTVVEGIIRRSIKPKIVNAINVVGLVALLLLMVIITVKDVFKLFH